jgi:hypothetical protein
MPLQFFGSCIVPFSLLMRSGPPRVPHLPSGPVTLSRVAPGLRPSAASATKLQVALHLQSIGCAGDGASSIPEVLMPERCRFRRLDGLPRLAAPPATPSIQCSGRPSFCIVRLCRRWSIESPRPSHPSAVPIGRSSGCPASQSFGIADDPFGELPRVANLPAPAGGRPELPRAGLPPVLLATAALGYPSSAAACKASCLIRGLPRFTCH